MASQHPQSHNTTERPSPIQAKKSERRQSLWKKLLFAVLSLALFFGILEVTLIALGVHPLSFTDDPYVGFASYLPLFVEEEDAEGNTMMRTAENKKRWFNNQQFPVRKRENTCRIFTLGGSTTYGRPYDERTAFSGWLKEFLPAIEPSRHWEVINAGGISYASYRVARVMEELNEYKPDLYIIYCGHNEFLERRTYSAIIDTPKAIRNMGSILGRTRTYSQLWRMLHDKHRAGNKRRKAEKKEAGRTELSAEVKSILDDAIGPDAYTRDRKLQRQIVAHFRFNLYRMIQMARSAGAKVVLVVPASNLRNCSPFKSEHDADLSDRDRLRFEELLRGAKQAYQQRRLESALRITQSASAIDGDFAHLNYLRGRILWNLGRHTEAAGAFGRARDEDVCPLRALTQMADIVRDVATKKKVPLVDFEALIAKQSEHGVAGERWFLDHVHPTIDGHRLLAEHLLSAIRAAGLLHADSKLREATKQMVIQRVKSRIDRRVHAAALRNLSMVLSWAGKHEESQRLALRAVAMIPDDPEAQYQAGNAYVQRREYDRAIACFHNSLRILPGTAKTFYGLGLCYERKRDTAKAITHYLQSVKRDRNFANAHYNVAGLFMDANDLKRATYHLREALRINPNDFLSHYRLGFLFARQNDIDRAQKHFELAIKAKATFADAHANLGRVHLQRGKMRRALDSFRTALRNQPGHFFSAYHLAEILATSPDDSLRDGKTALFWAQRLAKQTNYRQPNVLAILAAACAETGDFVNAVKWQQAALDRQPASRKAAHQSRLILYRAGKPYRKTTSR